MACRAPVAALLAALLLVAGCAAPAGGLMSGLSRIEARLTKSLTAETNRSLEEGNDDVLLTAALNAGLVLNAETQRALVSASLGLATAYYEGSDNLAGTGRVDPRAGLSAVLRGRDLELRADGTVAFSSTDTTQIDDTGITDVNATQITGRVGLALAWDLDGRNRLTGRTDASVIAFDEDVAGLNPTRTFSLGVDWRRALGQTTTFTLGTGVRYFSADNAAETRSQTLDLTGRLNHRRTSRHTVRLSLGASALRTVDSVGTGTPEFDIGFTGGAGLDYRLANLALSVDVSQGIEPSSVGALQAFTRFGGRVSYRVNARESVSADANFTRRSPVSGEGETLSTFSMGPRYTLALDRDTQLAVNYALRLQDNAGGIGLGHRVQLTLDRRFSRRP